MGADVLCQAGTTYTLRSTGYPVSGWLASKGGGGQEAAHTLNDMHTPAWHAYSRMACIPRMISMHREYAAYDSELHACLCVECVCACTPLCGMRVRMDASVWTAVYVCVTCRACSQVQSGELDAQVNDECMPPQCRMHARMLMWRA